MDNQLSFTERGRGEALLLLHGFSTSGGAWDEQARAFAAAHRVVAPDLLGHGRSPVPRDAARYSMQQCVADLVALLDRLGIERAHCLGYSMGGRVALALALHHPRRLHSLALESASPGIANVGERYRRRDSDATLAAHIEAAGVSDFVDQWMSQPLFATLRSLPAARWNASRALRLANSPLGLANSLRGLGTGAQPSYWERLGELSAPTLLVTGALDKKFDEIAGRMAERIPHAKRSIISGAGHATHLERPAEFAAAVAAFLETREPLGHSRPPHGQDHEDDDELADESNRDRFRTSP